MARSAHVSWEGSRALTMLLRSGVLIDFTEKSQNIRNIRRFDRVCRKIAENTKQIFSDSGSQPFFACLAAPFVGVINIWWHLDGKIGWKTLVLGLGQNIAHFFFLIEVFFQKFWLLCKDLQFYQQKSVIVRQTFCKTIKVTTVGTPDNMYVTTP